MTSSKTSKQTRFRMEATLGWDVIILQVGVVLPNASAGFKHKL